MKIFILCILPLIYICMITYAVTTDAHTVSIMILVIMLVDKFLTIYDKLESTE